jgi:HD-like signal output (HDOD) protein
MDIIILKYTPFLTCEQWGDILLRMWGFPHHVFSEMGRLDCINP